MFNYNSKGQYDIPEGYEEQRVQVTQKEIDEYYDEMYDYYMKKLFGIVKEEE